MLPSGSAVVRRPITSHKRAGGVLMKATGRNIGRTIEPPPDLLRNVSRASGWTHSTGLKANRMNVSRK